ncbi:MAG TPA: RNA-binding S4 domain-containing protein [Verrucomicrobiales bacterium]|nr:RNA-binding S4 domain-containing protein [Verrucomicrobiales bacterium]
MPPSTPAPLPAMRVDKWLWAVRLCKTRQQATDACRLQRVRIAGEPVKPSRLVKAGETIEVRQEDLTRTVRVKQPIGQRVGAKLVPESMEDLTPAAEIEAAARRREERRLNTVTFEHGRPEKRDRRVLEAFLEKMRSESE